MSRIKQRSRGRAALHAAAAPLLFALLGAGALALTACERENDRMGEAMEELEDEAKDAKEELEDEVDDHS